MAAGDQLQCEQHRKIAETAARIFSMDEHEQHHKVGRDHTTASKFVLQFPEVRKEEPAHRYVLAAADIERVYQMFETFCALPRRNTARIFTSELAL